MTLLSATVQNLSRECPSATRLLEHLVNFVKPQADEFSIPSNETDYNQVLNLCTTIKNNMTSFSSPRVLYCAPDGTVIVDTSKSNSFIGYSKDKSINENHNSRIAIMFAQMSLFGNGMGVEEKYSTSTKKTEIYAACLVRGKRFSNQGTLRISYTQ